MIRFYFIRCRYGARRNRWLQWRVYSPWPGRWIARFGPLLFEVL